MVVISGVTPSPPVVSAPTAAAPVPVDTSTLPATVTSVTHQNAPLLNPVFPAGIGVVALLATGTTILRLRRRRHRPGRRWGGRTASGVAGFGSLVLVVLTVAAAVNAYAGYLPTPDAAKRFLTGRGTVSVSGSTATSKQALLHTAGGAQAIAAGDTHWVSSSLSLTDPGLRIRNRRVLVALPPGYSSTHIAYPVLYLFSGYPGRAADWFVSGRITQSLDALAAAGKAPYAICVAPDVNGGFFNDSETVNAANGAQVETWVTRDVVSYVDSHYRTRPHRSARILAGMSSGGYAAINIALRHQDEFGTSLALEPYGDPGNITKRLFGGSTALLHANSPSYYAPKERLTRRLPFFLDVGSGGDVRPVTALAAVLNARREPVLLRIENGQRHTWTEAAAGLPYALTFAAGQLSNPTALDATYPASRFPATGSDPYANQISVDGEVTTAEKVSCDRAIKRAGRTTRSIPRMCAGFDRDCSHSDLTRLPQRLTGAELTVGCPPRRFILRPEQ